MAFTVVALAVLGAAIVLPLAVGVPVAAWLRKVLVMFVIARPCALVISTPVTVVIRAIALDKTGTPTQGRPAVTVVELLAAAWPVDVLMLAASLNAHSIHPLADAVMAAAPVGRMMHSSRWLLPSMMFPSTGPVPWPNYYLVANAYLGDWHHEVAPPHRTIASNARKDSSALI